MPPGSVVVGGGRLGKALSAALGLAGSPPILVAGRTAAADPAAVLKAVPGAGPGAVVLLAVPDRALAALAAGLADAGPRFPPGTAFLHHSGALGVDVLAPLAARGASLGSCHPLQSFPGTASDPGRFEGIFFAVDGDGRGLEMATLLARALGGRPVSIAAGARALYHLGASLGANGLTGLVAASRDALVAAGLSADEALAALAPLLRGALEEALRLGPEGALTGPAARGDDETLAMHRRALLGWDASRTALFEALLREQRRLSPGEGRGGRC